MKPPVKPHISEALRHLRGGITFAGVIVALCATVQLLVFGFVHFTEIRWERAAPVATYQAPTVVASDRAVAMPSAATGKAPSILLSEPEPAPKPVEEKAAPTPKPASVTVPGAPRPGLVYSRWDAALGFYSDAAVTVGIMAAFLVALLTFQGVIVGSQVPGIEKAVGASTWAIILALISLPWRDALPKVPFGGVFGSYDAMTKASAAAQLGQIPGPAIMAEYLLLPLMALVCGLLIIVRFRAGIERGVIITSVNELDAALSREMRDIAKRGPASTAIVRSVGALNQAIGDRPSDPLMDQLLAPAKPGKPHPAEPDTARTRAWVSPSDRQPNDDEDGPRRPI